MPVSSCLSRSVRLVQGHTLKMSLTLIFSGHPIVTMSYQACPIILCSSLVWDLSAQASICLHSPFCRICLPLHYWRLEPWMKCSCSTADVTDNADRDHWAANLHGMTRAWWLIGWLWPQLLAATADTCDTVQDFDPSPHPFPSRLMVAWLTCLGVGCQCDTVSSLKRGGNLLHAETCRKSVPIYPGNEASLVILFPTDPLR